MSRLKYSFNSKNLQTTKKHKKLPSMQTVKCLQTITLLRLLWELNPPMWHEPSTATSDVPKHYTTEASPKEDTQVAYITLPDPAVHSV